MDSQWRFNGTALRTLMAQERAQLMAKERAQIFSLYEQGPRKRLFVDIGDEHKDNDEFISDRFGFLREKPQPQDSALGTKQRRTESRRLRKWVKMLNNYSKYHGSKKFQQRCFKGMPSEVRGKEWKLMLSVDIKKAQNPGTFEVLKE
ncbi:TBC1 domain family member 26-like [Ochotona princeps]|uniref:TBC1 domain family member 26-like n=1 Tax=Ochotona princeps TaxID=9978 RepID=UPI0027144DDA|nr:TBC1 domain family member 26-like [Ochotona princeps]